MRMDMTQMVRQAVDTAGPDVSVNRDKGDVYKRQMICTAATRGL